MAVTTVSTHFAYTQTDGQAELARVARLRKIDLNKLINYIKH